jgi:hypothetical protein
MSNAKQAEIIYQDECISIPLAILFVLLEALVLFRGFAVGLELTHLIIAVSMLFIYVQFFSLRTTVTRDELVVSYGIGLIQNGFSLSALENMRVETDHNMLSWLYDPFGSEVVSIGVRMGKRLQIPTHEPAQLLTAMRSR